MREVATGSTLQRLGGVAILCRCTATRFSQGGEVVNLKRAEVVDEVGELNLRWTTGGLAAA